MQVQPYLSFEGRCDEAIEFYKKAIGAKVDMLMRFKEAPDQSMMSPGSADKVMHAALRAGDTQMLMSDGRCTGSPNFHGICAGAQRRHRRRRGTDLQRAGRRRQSEHADGEDVLLVAFRHAGRQVRRRLDGSGRRTKAQRTKRCSGGSRCSPQPKTADFVISRVFDAPRDLVWQCFTEPERMKEWWGPKGSTIVASKMDLRVGGTYHGAMRDPGGRVMWAKFVYREIVAPDRLVWVHSFSDEAGGLTRHPLSATWPLELLTTVMFDDAARRKDQSHHPLVAAQRHGRGETRPSTRPATA